MSHVTFSLVEMQDFAGPGVNHHTDPDVAKAVGLPDPILQGVQLGPLAIARLTEVHGELARRWVRSTYVSHIFPHRPVEISLHDDGASSVHVRQEGRTSAVVEVADQPRPESQPDDRMASQPSTVAATLSDLMTAPISDVLREVRFALTAEWVDRAHRASKVHTVDQLAGHGRINPGLLMQAYYWLFEDRVHQDGLLHAKQDFRWFTTPAVGDELAVTGALIDRYVKRGRTYAVVSTATHDAKSGEPVAESIEHCTWKTT